MTDDGVVTLRLTGACHGCPMSRVTLHHWIEREIRSHVPDVTAVEEEPKQVGLWVVIGTQEAHDLGEVGGVNDSAEVGGYPRKGLQGIVASEKLQVAATPGAKLCVSEHEEAEGTTEALAAAPGAGRDGRDAPSGLG